MTADAIAMVVVLIAFSLVAAIAIAMGPGKPNGGARP